MIEIEKHHCYHETIKERKRQKQSIVTVDY